MLPQEFYLIPEELFRLGNRDNPRLSNVRPRDVSIAKLNGIDVIIANGKGVSVFDKEGINESPMTGWVWCFPISTLIPTGLKLVKNKTHHFCIAPVHNMPLDKYKGLLEEMALYAKRVFKKEGRAV
jgi:hypothetical protein